MSTVSIPSSTVPTAASGSNRVLLALWALFPVLVPFYLFGRTPVVPMAAYVRMLQQGPVKVESGVPQPADFLMAGLMGLIFLAVGFRFNLRVLTVVKALAAFVAYTTLVNLTWTVVLADSELSLLRNALFYFYDFLLFCAFLVLHSEFKDRLLRVTLYAVAASVFLQALLSPLAFNRGQFRQALFFNNFNQLGYYAVLAASIFFLGTRHFRVRTELQSLFLLAVAYLAFLSLSKAAIFAFALLVLLVFARRPLVLVLGTLALLMTAFVADAGGLAEKLEQRLYGQDSDDSLAKRGYDRIANHAEYLVFGAGEGFNSRFVSEHPGEMHSSFGTLLFAYGVIGFALFSAVLVAIGNKAHWRDMLFLVPPFAYGLAHQGLRFTLFWVLLAFLVCLGKQESAENTAERPDWRSA